MQLIALGGSVGAATFVDIGTGEVKGGPGCLLLVYMLYSPVFGLVNNCMAEMAVSHLSLELLIGWWVGGSTSPLGSWPVGSSLLYEAVLIPFEISAHNLVLTFRRDGIPVAAVGRAPASLTCEPNNPTPSIVDSKSGERADSVCM